jgi:hypothetical protein
VERGLVSDSGLSVIGDKLSVLLSINFCCTFLDSLFRYAIYNEWSDEQRNILSGEGPY